MSLCAGATSRGECEGAAGYGAALPSGRMTGKRKHSEICSQILMEHRLATRCRNLSLNDTTAPEGVDERERDRILEESIHSSWSRTVPPALSTRDVDAPPALDLPGSAQGEAVGTTTFGSSCREQQLEVAGDSSGGVVEGIEAGAETAPGMAMSGPVAVAPRVPSITSDHGDAVACSACRHGTSSVEGEQDNALALCEEGAQGRRAPTDPVCPDNAEACKQVAPVQCSVVAPGKACGGSSSSTHLVAGDEDSARERERERRLLQDKEGGIHMSCDPLASLPLEELAQSAATTVPLPSALLSSLALSTAASEQDDKVKASHRLGPTDAQLLPASLPLAPPDRSSMESSSPAGAAGSVPRSPCLAGGATALEVAPQPLPRTRVL